MAFIITVLTILALLAAWVAFIRRDLATMEGNVDNAVNQLGIFISSRYNTLARLSEVMSGYAAQDSAALMEAVRARRAVISAKSTPADILKQEAVVLEAFRRISAIAEQHPELLSDESYTKYMNTDGSVKNMMRTARLIYNDSVAKLNRSMRRFPTNLIAGMLGFRQREYLEAAEGEL